MITGTVPFASVTVNKAAFHQVGEGGRAIDEINAKPFIFSKFSLLVIPEGIPLGLEGPNNVADTGGGFKLCQCFALPG